MENRISFNVDPALIKSTREALERIKESLPGLVTLSVEDRRFLPKMGDKSLAFVEKALEYASQNPNFVPSYLDMDEFHKDVQAVKDLRSLIGPVDAILEKLDDSQILAGSEAYVAALTFYDSVKRAIRSNVPGAKLIYDELKVRFPSRRKQKEPDI